jgi:hypothetical protein
MTARELLAHMDRVKAYRTQPLLHRRDALPPLPRAPRLPQPAQNAQRPRPRTLNDL